LVDDEDLRLAADSIIREFAAASPKNVIAGLVPATPIMVHGRAL
jgi:hypothetical protein